MLERMSWIGFFARSPDLCIRSFDSSSSSSFSSLPCSATLYGYSSLSISPFVVGSQSIVASFGGPEEELRCVAPCLECAVSRTL